MNIKFRSRFLIVGLLSILLIGGIALTVSNQFDGLDIKLVGDGSIGTHGPLIFQFFQSGAQRISGKQYSIWFSK